MTSRSFPSVGHFVGRIDVPDLPEDKGKIYSGKRVSFSLNEEISEGSGLPHMCCKVNLLIAS